jgi:hypothetical protein
MATKDKDSVAVQMVTQAQASRDPANVRVRQELNDIFGGSLMIVNWASLKENRDYENYVYFDGDQFHLFYNTAEVTRYLSQKNPSSASGNLLREVLSVGGVPAVIAILITVTICYLVLARGAKDIPEVLGNALSIILGFYFGSKVTKDHETKSRDRTNKT